MKQPSQGREVLPLAGAAERLRRPPGRPRKVNPPGGAPAIEANALPSRSDGTGSYEAAVPGLCPRLLDLGGTAAYLGVSGWTVRDLEAAGELRRVRIPVGPGRELRKLLFDRQDLDRLLEVWKDSR